MSGEPKPLLWLSLLAVALGVWLVVWWLQLSEAEQQRRLQVVAWQERTLTGPPVTLDQQPRWLAAHRWRRVHGLVGLLGLAAVMGLGEGLAFRRRDALAGFRLSLWTIGLVLGLLLVWTAVAFLVLPWPVTPLTAGSVGVGLSGLASFGMAAGRPSIP